jgi:hypothetical protein
MLLLKLAYWLVQRPQVTNDDDKTKILLYLMVLVPAPLVVLISILVLNQTVLSSSSSQRKQAENRARRQRPQPIEDSVRCPGNPSLLGVVRVVIGWPPSRDSGGGYGALARRTETSRAVGIARRRRPKALRSRPVRQVQSGDKGFHGSVLIMIPELIACAAQVSDVAVAPDYDRLSLLSRLSVKYSWLPHGKPENRYFLPPDCIFRPHKLKWEPTSPRI